MNKIFVGLAFLAMSVTSTSYTKQHCTPERNGIGGPEYLLVSASNEQAAHEILTRPENSSLQTVDLSTTPLRCIPPSFNQLVHLTALYLRNCGITSLNNMPSLRALKNFSLEGNALQTLVGFPPLDGLESLVLRNNRIETLIDLPALPRLTCLDLANNRITSLDGLQTADGEDKVPCLQRILLEGNPALPSEAGASLKNLGAWRERRA